MHIDPLIEIILQLWDELPRMMGERWPAAEPMLALFLIRHDDAPDVETRNRTVVEFEDWLDEQEPGLLAFLEERMEAEKQKKGGAYSLDSRGAYDQIMASIRAGALESAMVATAQPRDIAPLETSVTRYTDIQLPARVQVDRRFSLIVGLTITPSPDSADAQPVQAGVGQKVRVVVSPAGALEVVGEREKELRVKAERDSDPVVFYLRAKQAGLHSLGLEFWVGGQIVATSRHSVEAVVEAVTEIPSRPAGQPIQAGETVAPYPDLVLRITTEGNQLHYDLHFADVRFVSLPGERLRTNPETFRYELIREIEQMAIDARKKGSSTATIERQLAKIGQRLYKELFSADLRREYRSFSRQITTLQIISDEPWIPWELIKPYDDEGGEIVDHDFLCMQFDLARWFTPAQAPAATIAAASLACIAPSDSKLDWPCASCRSTIPPGWPTACMLTPTHICL